jgi:hypothetical protein
MSNVLALLVCVVAFAALAAATDRHQRTFFARAVSPRRARGLRIVGWAGLALALWIAVAHQGWALGLVHYSGQTSLAAGLVYLALIVRDRRRPSR